KWTAPVKNLKQDCERAKIEYLQVKQINQLATGSGAIYNDNRITSGKRCRDVNYEEANTKKRNITNVNSPDDKTPGKCSSNKVGGLSENKENDDSNELLEFKHDELEELEQQITISSLSEWNIGTVNVSRKFKEYQRQLISSVRQKKRQVLNSNPYKIAQPILTDSLLTTLYKVTNNFSLDLNYNFNLNNDDGELGENAYHPFIKVIFGGEYTSYSLELNKSVSGKQRPDFSCVVDDIAILNSEIKPMGYTQFRKVQDFVKVHLKGRESINKLLEKGGPNKSIAFLNMGDTIESFAIDLVYDGVYRS
ncbi:7109_t:CDS:2, partial [Diversispora eburnea]